MTSPATAVSPVDWTRTVTQTPDGAFVLGSPRATRVVEYISYTCSHCAHFVGEGSTPLRANWIKRGLVSLEVRNAIRDPYDLTAAVLARCGGKDRFFANHEALFANQSAWMEKLQTFEAKRADMPPAKDASAQLIAIANGTGLSALMVKRGVSMAQQRTCFADKAMLAQIAAMAKDAWEDRKIGGTPSFAVGGKLLPDAHDWDSLRAALPALTN